MNTNNTINYEGLMVQSLLDIFESNHVYFPRKLRIDAMRKVLESKYIDERKRLEAIKNEDPQALSLKEYMRLHRVQLYAKLSEFQLEKDFEYYNDHNLMDLYLKLFWDDLSKHINTLEQSEKVFDEINKLAKTENEKIASVFDFNQLFKKRVLDDNDFFDGVHLVDSISHFNDTSVAAEIRSLSEKYDIFIPKYWTKADLQVRIKKTLKLEGKLTQEIIDKVDNSSLKIIKVMLDEYNVDSKLHITKTDMINIIIKNVDKNKVTEVAREEEVIVDEPSAPEVVEEVVPVTPQMVVSEGKDYEDLLKQIIKNQEIMIQKFDLLENDKRAIEKDTTKMDRIFNYVVITLIILVSMVWIVYGVTTLF